MNFPTLLATLWRNREYGVALAGAILVVLGIASLMKQEPVPGWYAVFAGGLLVVMVVVKFMRKNRNPGDPSERDNTN